MKLIPRKIQTKTLNLRNKMTKGMKQILKFPEEIIIPTQNACGPSVPRIANDKGLSQKICVVQMVVRVCFITVPHQMGNLSISLGLP